MHPGLAIMLHPGLGHGSDHEPEHEDMGDEEGGADEGKMAAMKAFFRAVKAGDAELGVKCLEKFCNIHAAPEEEPDGDEEEKD